jgi:hypothetical protein
MRIAQADFRSVQIEKGSTCFRLRYSLFQDGEIRYPESITCQGDTVVAYFLTSTIRDYLAENARGLSVERHWKIVPEGSFGLNFCLEFPANPEMTYLFPGLSAGPIGESGCLAAGDRSAYANGVYLFRDPESVCLFCDPARRPEEAGSIELQPLPGQESEGFLRAEIRVPAAPAVAASPAAHFPAAASAGASKKSQRKGGRGELFFESRGEFEYTMRLNIVTAPKEAVLRRATGAVLERNTSCYHAPTLRAGISAEYLAAQVRGCLEAFLTEQGPVCGLAETATGNSISSLAGCTLALMQLRYLGSDPEAVELSRRLADFTLKGQHPKGLFYPSYWTDRQSWLAPGVSPATATIEVRESAGIALMLLRIAGALHSRGLPASAYLHGASHMAEALSSPDRDPYDLSGRLYPDSLEPAAPAGSSPVLAELFLELAEATGGDRYRKAVQKLRSTLVAPGMQTASDLELCLLQAQTAVSLQEAGYGVKGLHRYFDALLPWLYLNNPGGSPQFNPFGGIRPSLEEPTLVFRGFEVAYTLMKLDSLVQKSTRLAELPLLVSQLLGFTVQRPMGTSHYDPAKREEDRFGPTSSVIWTRELYYLTRLFEELPEVLEEHGLKAAVT